MTPAAFGLTYEPIGQFRSTVPVSHHITRFVVAFGLATSLGLGDLIASLDQRELRKIGAPLVSAAGG
jgi:hypothetical protein